MGLEFGLGLGLGFRVRVRVRSKPAFHGERWRTTYGAPSISIQPVNGSVYEVSCRWACTARAASLGVATWLGLGLG